METDTSSPSATELHNLLTENLKVANENNHILHRMQYWGRVAFWAKVLIWVVVLALPFLLYTRFAPFLNILPGGIGGSTNASSTSLFGFPSPTEFQKTIHPGS
ncbi:hypothetical protein H0X32_03290 [Patescibacteria group bacterium]|nr:hypothetical protein [Patescibacteria group bacterium]